MRDRLFWLLCAAALAVQIRLSIPGINSGNIVFFYRPDTMGYLEEAMALASGNGFGGLAGRAPGFPVLLAMIYRSTWLAQIVLALVGILSAMPVYLAARRYAGRGAALTASGLILFNLTAVANRPLWLSDTLFGLAVAWQIYFLLGFLADHRLKNWLCTIAVAAIGALIRPINIAWIFPALVILAVLPELQWKKKVLYGLAGLLLFFAIPAPWQIRNARLGARYCIDTNTGAMYHQNGAMILAAVNHSGFEKEKAKILQELDREFADTTRYPDEKSRTAYRLKRFRELIASHPFIWLRQHFSPYILLPDIPAFCEDIDLTSGNRGTLGVLHKQGLRAAVMHYFGGLWFLPLLLLPLLIPTGLLVLGFLRELVLLLKDWKKSYPMLLAILAGAEYYFFLPGPITVPRYQIPALPILCILGGAGLMRFVKCWKARKKQCGGNPEKDVCAAK